MSQEVADFHEYRRKVTYETTRSSHENTTRSMMTYFDSIKAHELVPIHEILAYGFKKGYCRCDLVNILTRFIGILNNCSYSIKERIALGNSFYEVIKHFLDNCGAEDFRIKADFNGKIYCTFVGLLGEFEINLHVFTDVDGKVHIPGNQGTKDISETIEPSVNFLIHERKDLKTGKLDKYQNVYNIQNYFYSGGDPIHKSRDEDLTFVDFQVDMNPHTKSEKVLAKYVCEFDKEKGSSSPLAILICPTEHELVSSKVKIAAFSKSIPKNVNYCFRHCIEDASGNPISKVVRTVCPTCTLTFNPKASNETEFYATTVIESKNTHKPICEKSSRKIYYLYNDAFSQASGYYQIISVSDIRANYFEFYLSQFAEDMKDDSKSEKDSQSKSSGDDEDGDGGKYETWG